MSAAPSAIVNAMTVDVEDYFQVSAFDDVVPRDQWTQRESRVVASTDRLLELFADAGVRATFFILGWVATKHPDLVRRIAAAGHEVASHGYGHRLVYDLTRQEFTEDVRRSRDVLAEITGRRILGYRAPSFSVTARSLWALDVLLEEGFVYDASIFPIHHDRYGIPTAPRHFHARELALGKLWECPSSTVRLGGTNLPVGGGGYFRLLPFAWTRWGMLGELGVPKDAIQLEDGSANTHESAVNVARLLLPSGRNHVLLVTDGKHMRRARGAFERAGLRVSPAPAMQWELWWEQPYYQYRKMDGAVHEYVGLLYYWWKGWI